MLEPFYAKRHHIDWRQESYNGELGFCSLRKIEVQKKLNTEGRKSKLNYNWFQKIRRHAKSWKSVSKVEKVCPKLKKCVLSWKMGQKLKSGSKVEKLCQIW